MPEYRRALHKGRSCFVTFNLLQRRNNALTRYVDWLYEAVYSVRQPELFYIHVSVLLTDICIE